MIPFKKTQTVTFLALSAIATSQTWAAPAAPTISDTYQYVDQVGSAKKTYKTIDEIPVDKRKCIVEQQNILKSWAKSLRGDQSLSRFEGIQFQFTVHKGYSRENGAGPSTVKFETPLKNRLVVSFELRQPESDKECKPVKESAIKDAYKPLVEKFADSKKAASSAATVNESLNSFSSSFGSAVVEGEAKKTGRTTKGVSVETPASAPAEGSGDSTTSGKK